MNESKLEKAKLTPEVGSPVEVLFNPGEYSIERSVNYASHAVPGMDIPIAQFVNGNADSLNMSLFFDTMAAYDAGGAATQSELAKSAGEPEGSKKDVRAYTQKIYGMMAVNDDLHAPPRVTFSWGSLSFEGYIVNVTQRFTMFTGSGIPVRATLDVRFQAAKTSDAQLRGTPRNSPDRTKYLAVREGDSLWAIAGREYDDCAQWREIARANGIENPRVLRTGRTLRVPALVQENDGGSLS